MNEELKNAENAAQEIKETESIPSMSEFEDEITKSFHTLKEGDIVTGTVIGVSDTEVTVDLSYYAEGLIKLEELSNDPRFSIKADMIIGDQVTATVIGEDRDGNILLSRKQADDVLSWESLEDMLKNKTIAKVKVAEAVNAGVVTYLKGIRAFIPASKLALEYVEDPSVYVGKELEVYVITADRDTKKLVLSAKDVLRDHAASEKNDRISHLQIGLVTKGKVDKIMPFGAFVQLSDGLSGLVHISQICGKHIKSPSEVVKVGDEVNVKILDVKDGKISLSMKAVEETEEVLDDVNEAPMEFSTGEDATTGLGALLKGIKLQ
ncbi:MAG: S1 RNA-binding domain-containing protein [Lachnospiraceae bacterium]|nr:S1 RNA-binding domain-containing protein [Lachnospiraceae bacterium]